VPYCPALLLLVASQLQSSDDILQEVGRENIEGVLKIINIEGVVAEPWH